MCVVVLPVGTTPVDVVFARVVLARQVTSTAASVVVVCAVVPQVGTTATLAVVAFVAPGSQLV